MSEATKNGTGFGIPKNVIDFATHLSQLRRDTGVSVLSFDWSNPMLETEDGTIYKAEWDENVSRYIVKKF